jgi:CubicO group peptidase (beta-lactamase class C family)
MLAVLVMSSCVPSGIRSGAPVVPIDPATVAEIPSMTTAAFTATMTERIDAILDSAILAGVASGISIAVGRNGGTAHLRGYGRTDWDAGNSSPVDENTIFDMASLTKVIATTTVAMILEERGELNLDATVASYLPRFDAADKATITVRQLLLHRGGLEAFAPLFRTYRGRDAYLGQINARPVRSAPGTRTEYSDWDMILVQLVIERITGKTLDLVADELVFRPLGMTATQFSPAAELKPRIAATEIDSSRGGLMHGVVHDENAWAMGGVAGHAGLFSTARDVALFAQMMLNGGTLNGVRILRPETIARWTARQGAESSRAIGWDTPSRGSSAGRYFSPRSFGHTGFTGTSIWLDPEKDLFVILLTNRVNPTRVNNRIGALRRAVADLVQESVVGARLIDWERSR